MAPCVSLMLLFVHQCIMNKKQHQVQASARCPPNGCARRGGRALNPPKTSEAKLWVHNSMPSTSRTQHRPELHVCAYPTRSQLTAHYFSRDSLSQTRHAAGTWRTTLRGEGARQARVSVESVKIYPRQLLATALTERRGRWDMAVPFSYTRRNGHAPKRQHLTFAPRPPSIAHRGHKRVLLENVIPSPPARGGTSALSHRQGGVLDLTFQIFAHFLLKAMACDPR